jgi:hypothetical protein
MRYPGEKGEKESELSLRIRNKDTRIDGQGQGFFFVKEITPELTDDKRSFVVDEKCTIYRVLARRIFRKNLVVSLMEGMNQT